MGNTDHPMSVLLHTKKFLTQNTFQHFLLPPSKLIFIKSLAYQTDSFTRMMIFFSCVPFAQTLLLHLMMRLSFIRRRERSIERHMAAERNTDGTAIVQKINMQMVNVTIIKNATSLNAFGMDTTV